MSIETNDLKDILPDGEYDSDFLELFDFYKKSIESQIWTYHDPSDLFYDVPEWVEDFIERFSKNHIIITRNHGWVVGEDILKPGESLVYLNVLTEPEPVIYTISKHEKEVLLFVIPDFVVAS